MLLIEILVFGFALWFGAYLISRNPSDRRLLLAGAGLIAYAIGLGFGILAGEANDLEMARSLQQWQKPLLLLPAICWILLLIHFINY